MIKEVGIQNFHGIFMQLSYFACNFTMKTNPHQLLVKDIMHNNSMFTKATWAYTETINMSSFFTTALQICSQLIKKYLIGKLIFCLLFSFGYSYVWIYLTSVSFVSFICYMAFV